MALICAYFPEEREQERADMVERLLGRSPEQQQKDKYQRDYLHDVVKLMGDCKDANAFEAIVPHN
jgi:hypothetical protein